MGSLRRFCSESKRLLDDMRLFLEDRGIIDTAPNLGGGGVLIVRIDAIGDYLLFRQSLRALRFSPFFNGKKMTLCGNAVWRPLAEALDGESFDAFIPVQRTLLHNDRDYRHKLMRALRRENFDLALQPTLSREYMGDSLVYASRAPQRIGFRTPGPNLSPAMRPLCDKWYTTLMESKKELLFELQRNREVLVFLGVPPENIPPFQGPFPDTILQKSIPGLGKDIMGLPILFVGASEPPRCWPPEHFARLATHIHHRWGKRSVLGGGESAAVTMRRIAALCPEAVIPTPKTSLPEMAALIARAPLIVSNDTSGAHMGATFNVPTIIISNGQGYGRFHPYPADVATQTVTLYPSGFTPNNTVCYYSRSPYNIADILPERVIEVADALMKRTELAAMQASTSV